jgi:hypothetical protein
VVRVDPIEAPPLPKSWDPCMSGLRARQSPSKTRSDSPTSTGGVVLGVFVAATGGFVLLTRRLLRQRLGRSGTDAHADS